MNDRMPTHHDDADVRDDANLLSPLFADGRALLSLGGLGLLLAGLFAVFLAFAGEFLPHDIRFLGMTAADLCARNGCRIVHFMIHDRASFGGTLIALATLYLWLTHFPLRAGEAWAWWALLVTNVLGFLSFLTYLGFGYLDTWHGLATLALLPCFTVGLALSWRRLPRGGRSIATLWRAAPLPPGRVRRGRLVLTLAGAGMAAAGATITVLGMTVVFVPQDLEYMGTTPAELAALNPRLIPLIAHDRAGFGGGVLVLGLLVVACARYGRPARHLWQAMTLAGAVAFGLAIGVHPMVGYNNPVHLAPAVAGAALYALGVWWSRPDRRQRTVNAARAAG